MNTVECMNISVCVRKCDRKRIDKIFLQYYWILILYEINYNKKPNLNGIFVVEKKRDITLKGI